MPSENFYDLQQLINSVIETVVIMVFEVLKITIVLGPDVQRVDNAIHLYHKFFTYQQDWFVLLFQPVFVVLPLFVLD